MTKLWPLGVFAAATLAMACGDSHETTDGAVDSGTVDGASDGGTTDSGTTDGTVDSGGGGGPCPAVLPEPSATCSPEGLVCEYGMRSCLATAECSGGTWTVTTPRCPPPPAGGCPATREDAQGTACAGDEGATCEYDSLLCHCTTCPDPYPLCMTVDPPVWACEAPNPDTSCPAAQPLLGTTCAMEGQTCDYGCEAGQQRVCMGGIWTAASSPGGCPISTRRVKRDIDYLEATEVDAIAREVLGTRLATYEYKDPALAPGRHLGFIIEDQPHSYSVDPERSQVDLYGYTSMLVAATQAQNRRIEELERTVTALQRQVQARQCAP